MEPYYYSQMNKVQQNAYHAMKTGLMSMAPLFMVPISSKRTANTVSIHTPLIQAASRV